MDFEKIASIFETLRLSLPSKLTLLDAQEFSSKHYPPNPPDIDLLILNVNSADEARQTRFVLSAAYADSHEVVVVGGGMRREEKLSEFGEGAYDFPVALFVPALEAGTSFEAFAEIVAHLRAPNGCPWDKEQTHQTLRRPLLEETYETLSAIDADDADGMREEFGDLLLQIVLNSYIAYQDGRFNFTESVKGVYDKIVRRHPHVFGDARLDSADGVLQNWEKLKEKEREGKKTDKGILDGISLALPALNQAQEYQARAARVGFDWAEVDSVLDKIREEIEEVKTAKPEDVGGELGDLLFALVNLCRWREVDAESALRGTNLKFKRRFAHVENGAKKQGCSLSEMSLAEMDALWNEAKALGL
ncbi:MAG: nucleoside triphosphate pyrophosphohydrolase [Anaerolineales bacterium]|nr:nucleoside triphosphate pyrophosphohydrolase [Anaerolineales bacterium]